MTWKSIKLGDAANLLIGFAFKSAAFLDANDEGVKLLRGDNVQQGYIRWGDKTKKWALHEYDDLEKYQLEIGDVILAMDRPIVGDGLKFAWIAQEDLPALLVQRVCCLRGKPSVALTSFLRFVIGDPRFSAHIHKITTGANIPHISGKDIAAYEFMLPEPVEQEEIVAILTAYDDLIAANQRRIQLLEESARLLYREWFVLLRFPGHETVSVTDGVPEGWSKKPFSYAADFINGFAFKPSHQLTEGLPIVKIPELRDGVSDRTPLNPGLDIPLRNKIDTGDLLFSWSATLLVNEWSDGPALLNQHLFKVVPKVIDYKRLIRFALEDAIPRLLGQSVGATMQHIRRGVLDEQQMLIPGVWTSQKFAEMVDPLIDQVLSLQAMNRGLIKARDMLLPKLMSRVLDVSRIAVPKEVEV